jgi:holo-[acyl-carrier protein] synthase
MELSGMKGIGVDVCSVERIEKVWKRFGARFLRRVLTPAEMGQRPWKVSVDAARLARRWAIKEAVAKAFGTGIGGTIGFQQIEVTHSDKGAPLVKVWGHKEHVLASVSDDAGTVVAFVVVG